MKPIPRRLLAPAAALACVLTIGTALFPREPSVSSDINDLQTAPDTYLGEYFSNTNPGIQNEFIGFQVTNVVGSKFTGFTIGAGVEGSVTAAGKFKMKVVPSKEAAAGAFGRRGPGILGDPNFQFTFAGQLSEGGHAIIGTYKLKSKIVDKGTFYMLLDND